MRNIKFRAWNDLNKKMFIPYTSNNTKNDFSGLNDNGLECSRYVGKGSWRIFTIMQFTGLHDKTGKEIFEGDIISIWYEESFFKGQVIGNVEWNQSTSRFIICFKSCTIDIGNQHEFEMEVVGNVYENPELLNKTASDVAEKKAGNE